MNNEVFFLTRLRRLGTPQYPFQIIPEGNGEYYRIEAGGASFVLEEFTEEKLFDACIFLKAQMFLKETLVT